MTEKFTLTKALAIQSMHLAQWEAVLNPEAYFKLKKHVEEENQKVKDPYDVFRGERMYEFVANSCMPKYTKEQWDATTG